jgi:hypothetical protein
LLQAIFEIEAIQILIKFKVLRLLEYLTSVMFLVCVAESMYQSTKSTKLCNHILLFQTYNKSNEIRVL